VFYRDTVFLNVFLWENSFLWTPPLGLHSPFAEEVKENRLHWKYAPLGFSGNWSFNVLQSILTAVQSGNRIYVTVFIWCLGEILSLGHSSQAGLSGSWGKRFLIDGQKKNWLKATAVEEHI